MNLIKYQFNNKKVKVFAEIQEKGRNIKQYQHPEGTYLYAYVRQLSADEQSKLNAQQDSSNILFVFNYRSILMQGLIVEFDEKLYLLGAPDNVEFNKIEIKFMAQEISPRTYDEITYLGWIK